MNARLPAPREGPASPVVSSLNQSLNLPLAAWNYGYDAWQRTILFLDLLRERGNQSFHHEKEGMPPVLVFDHEIVLDGRELPKPVNYALLRILPPAGVVTDERKRPFVVIDPRAGHGPGIGGFKIDSEIGIALRRGHPCYFISFFPTPCPGQTIECVARAEHAFLQAVIAAHPDAEAKPFVIGNCQGGWALMLLAAAAPDGIGPLLLAGSPLAYWSGVRGTNPMRYSGGLLGGSWLASLASDLGNGRFDGAWLVQNFEQLNPSNTLWTKLHDIYADVDDGGKRFLDFERWWGGHYLLNREEIEWIVQNLFVGNQLTAGNVRGEDGKAAVDLRNIRSPIIVFASWGDNITPPQQALNWIPDLYADVDEIVANDQVIVYCLHRTIGHLGIFVSSAVANREHSELVSALDLIDVLPPGLYEAKIEDIKPGTSHLDLIEGRYMVRFERRTVDDILALDDGRDDERAFEVVRRVSDVNQRLYDLYAAPVVRALSNEVTAQAMRQMHPARLERSLFSDANPWMQWVAAFAPTVSATRERVTPDNPFVAMEQAVSQHIVDALDSFRDRRDAWSEQYFQWLYESPWLAAMVGMAPAMAPAGAPSQNKALRHELAVMRLQRLEAQIDKGNTLDAFVRILLYLSGDTGAIEVRPFNLMRRMAREHLETRPTLEEFKSAVKTQSAILKADAPRAIAALPTLLYDKEVARRCMEAIRQIAEVKGPLDGDHLARYTEVMTLLALDQSARPRANGRKTARA